jgi:cell division transport system permease protein
MTLMRALGFFFSEACLGLLRSWRVSVLASLAIAVSLFTCGLFLLVSGNLELAMDQWREETRIVVYLGAGAGDRARATIRERIEAPEWILSVEEISDDEATDRFVRMFPSLEQVLRGWAESPLPVSFEVAYDGEAVATVPFAEWVRALEASPEVTMVDDDRDWLRQLERIVQLLRGGGLLLAAAMLAAAILTIASVIRLTVYLYRDEISTLRLVGATEFYIRGPFYFEGLLQGLLGGLVAVIALWLFHRSLDLSSSADLLGVVLLDRFIDWRQIAMLVLLGAAAGFFGAVVSLRRESVAGAD